MDKLEQFLTRAEAVLGPPGSHAAARRAGNRLVGGGRVSLAQAPGARLSATGAGHLGHYARRPAEHRSPERADRAEHASVRAQAAGQQRAADGRARHRQVVADQGVPERLLERRPASDRSGQGRSARSRRYRRPDRAAAGALHGVLRRPVVRRRRIGLQGAEGGARRLDRRAVGQRADLRDVEPPPSAARVHERQRDVQTHVRWRDSSRRTGRRKDLAVRAFRAVGQLLSVQAGRLPVDHRPLAASISAATTPKSKRRAAMRSCGRWNAARARGAWRGSSRATGPAGRRPA